MASLQTIQVLGVLTKVGTLGLGVVQTAIILRFLSPEAYGIVGIVVSLGALVGVSQHVGVVDAAIREIAVADTPRRRAAVFWVSLWFRLAVTVPISLLLYTLAPWIGTRLYALPDIPHLVRLLSGILILHGVQGVLGGAYTGQRAFGALYALQLLMAVLNVPIFAGLVWWHGVRGFFEAVIAAALGFSVLLALFLRSALGGELTHPRWSEARAALADIIHTGVWTYVARIFSVAWQRFPILLLGRWAPPEVVGVFSAATTFGSKLQLLAAALGEVNLAFLSSAYATSRDTFLRLARRTLEDVGAVTILGGLGLVVFARELVPFLAGPAYRDVIAVVGPVTWGYAAFAFLDIASNTVFVPARRANLRAASFGVLLAGTLAAMFLLRSSPALAAPAGMVAGGALGLAWAAGLASLRMKFGLFPRTLVVPLFASLALATFAPASLAARVFLVLAISLGTAWIAFPSIFTRLRAPFRVP